jgi:predicted phage terminase large subunit-like protein
MEQQAESTGPILSSEDCVYLLSLPDSELEAFLASLPRATMERVIQELQDWRSPKERAEASLYEFVQQAWHHLPTESSRTFVDNWHVRAICDHLQAVTEDRLHAEKGPADLLINVPPAHMKSLLVCVFWPCWEWGPRNRPDLRVMHCSYSESNVTRDAGKRKDLIDSDWYRANWGHRVEWKKGENRKLRYENTRGGWMWGLTVGGQGTGEHPDRLLIDDPHDAQEIVSETMRERVISWWRDKMSSRGANQSVRRALVMQRLHSEDLAGHWLQSRRDRIVHICLPYEYEPDRMTPTPLGFSDPRTEPGELLWPDLFTPEKREAFDNMTPQQQAGQLQQRPPTHVVGAEWPEDWFDDRIWFDDWPQRHEIASTVISLDPSLGKTERGDFAAFTITKRRAHDGRIFTDAVMVRADPMRLAEIAIELHATHKADTMTIESVAFQEVLEPLFQLICQRRGMLLPVRLIPRGKKSKRSRILDALTYHLRHGEIKLKSGSDGAIILHQQLKGFGSATYDDGPDSLADNVNEQRRLWAIGEGAEDEEEVL